MNNVGHATIDLLAQKIPAFHKMQGFKIIIVEYLTFITS